MRTQVLFFCALIKASAAKSSAHLFCAADWASSTSIESLGLSIIAGGQGPNCSNASGSSISMPNAAGVMLDTVNVYHAGNDTWELLHLQISARSYLTATSCGTRAYFAGGEYTPAPGMLGKKPNTDGIDIYDFSTRVWTNDTLSIARKKLAACTMSDRWVAFAGGIDDAAVFSTRVDILDTQTGKWAAHEMATPRMYFPAVCVDGVAVFAAGQQTALEGPLINNGGWDVFDSKTGQWTNGSLPSGHARDKVAGTWARNAQGQGLALIVGMGTVDIYNVATQTWSNRSEIVQRGGNNAAATIGNGRFALFMGGTGGPGGMSDAVEVYDAHDDVWFMAEPMSEGRGYLMGTGTSAAAIVAGGERASDRAVSDAVDIYTVADILHAKDRFFSTTVSI